MNIALFLALAATTVAIFDIGYSWKASSATGIQVSFARHHWGLINMDTVAPGFREKLPGNVELWSSSVWANVRNEHPNFTAKVLSRVSTVPLALILLAIIWMLRGIVLTAIGTDNSEGDPFIRANVRRLRIISVLLLVTPLIDSWAQMAETEWVIRALPKDVASIEFDLSSALTFFGVGVLVMVLAEVFKIGVRLREDVEGLV